jgi:hypothetical protein
VHWCYLEFSRSKSRAPQAEKGHHLRSRAIRHIQLGAAPRHCSWGHAARRVSSARLLIYFASLIVRCRRHMCSPWWSWSSVEPRHGGNTSAITCLALHGARCVFTGGDINMGVKVETARSHEIIRTPQIFARNDLRPCKPAHVSRPRISNTASCAIERPPKQEIWLQTTQQARRDD